MTARNMDWYWPVNTYFYAFPRGTVNRGLSAESAAEFYIALSDAEGNSTVIW
ncbi:hypothetical protein ACIL2K_000394 [Vibrio vulnificus]